MRAFISVDMEGMPHIVSPEHLSLKRALYGEARKIMTRITKCVCEELHNNGFDEVLIADSHGPMVNLLVEELPDYTQVVRGFPRTTSMVSLIEECNVAVFLGYHAKFGTRRATMDHTYSGASIRYVKVNGIEVSELLLNSYVAGHYGIPVILVAGDEKLIKDDVKEYLPWAEYVILKRSIGRYSAVSRSIKAIESELRSKTKSACENVKTTRPLRTEYPVNLEIRLLNSAYADTAELIPGVMRLDALTIRYQARDIIEAYKVMELVALSAAGTRAVISDLSSF